ncbi:MAG: AEC family transporter [Candidatus Peregrinibacteria bacterium]|nr:AEC family transporter [Candidatus Peregrinibacteria bacterium]
MMDQVLLFYVFVATGIVTKKLFGDKIDNKKITKLTVFFFQPILVFWGLSRMPLSPTVWKLSVLYFVVMAVAGLIFYLIGRVHIKDAKLRSIFMFAGTNGNTGNIGIPMGLAVFGPYSVIYTTMINFANVVWNFLFGVYIYSRGESSVTESIKNIFKMPILWSGIIAVTLNLYGYKFSEDIMQYLKYGAYLSIFMQLFLLGLFIAEVKVKKIHWPMNVWTIFAKFMILPALGLLGLYLSERFLDFAVPTLIKQIFMLQLFVPLAVNNVNLASLFNCKPRIVSELVFFTTLLFLLVSPVVFRLFNF